MRFLVAEGHDAVHVHDVGLTSRPDPDVLDAAVSEQRVLITLDTDFATLIAHARSALPSVLLFRGNVTRGPSDQSRLLLANLDAIAEDLHAGAVVVIGDDRVRIRRLPIL